MNQQTAKTSCLVLPAYTKQTTGKSLTIAIKILIFLDNLAGYVEINQGNDIDKTHISRELW